MSTHNMKKYTLDEIFVGMHIEDPAQLSEIYDTWIIMTKDIDKEGYTIGFIGAEPTEESDKLFKHPAGVCPVYNSSEGLDEDVEFID